MLQVIEETLSPTWDESMVFEEILVYGRREDIKANPPIIIVETYDQDKVRIRKLILVTSWENFAGWKSRVSWQSHCQTSRLSGRGGKYGEIQTKTGRG